VRSLRSWICFWYLEIKKERTEVILLPMNVPQFGGLRHPVLGEWSPPTPTPPSCPTPAMRDGDEGNYCRGRKALQLGCLTCHLSFQTAW
jgi:hypothetical protein